MSLQNITNTSTENSEVAVTCQQYRRLLYTQFGLFVYGAVASILVAFFEKRKYKSKICYGRPGIPMPVNLLDGCSNSVANAAAFGCTLEHILHIIFFERPKYAETEWLLPLFLFLTMFLMGITYYPIFASINSSSRIGGSAIGFLYTVILFLVTIYENFLCTTIDVQWAIHPVFWLCRIYLIFLFLYRFFTGICKKSRNIKEVLVKPYQIKHVHGLFRKQVTECEQKDIKSMVTRKMKCIAEEAKLCCLHESLYRCTTRTLAINSLVLLFFYEQFLLTSYLIHAISEDKIRALLPVNVPLGNPLIQHVLLFIEVIRVSLIFANISSAIYLVANMIIIYISQKQHIKQLWKGDVSFIPSNCQKMSRADILMKNIMYSGCQVSHFICGYICIQWFVLLLGLIIAYLFILPLMGRVPEVFLAPVKFMVPAVLFPVLLTLILRFTCHKAFLQDHYISEPGDESEWIKVLALDNRLVYHNLSYFLYFYYILTGLFKCFIRIICALMIGIFYIPRMDKSLLYPGFEHFDRAFMTYVGFLHVELYHCHPVLVVFCDQLMKLTQLDAMINSTDNGINERFSHLTVQRVYDRRLRNRWQKVLTLMSNPVLCKDSKTNVHFTHSSSVRTTFIGSKYLIPQIKI